MGVTHFEWLGGHGQLVMRTHIPQDWQGLVSSWATITRDAADLHYTVDYVDNRGVAERYTMLFTERVWTLERISREISLRFTGKLSEDNNKITGEWEKSTDGVSWQRSHGVNYWRHIEGQ